MLNECIFHQQRITNRLPVLAIGAVKKVCFVGSVAEIAFHFQKTFLPLSGMLSISAGTSVLLLVIKTKVFHLKFSRHLSEFALQRA